MLIDYLNITKEQAAEICATNCADFGIDELSIDEVMNCFSEGGKLVKRAYGFAIVRPEFMPKMTKPSFLYFIFIDPSQRGKKHGSMFVRELLREFSREYIMYLICFGPERRRFFGRAGFCVESREQSGRRVMKSKCK